MKMNKILVSLCAAGVMASPMAYATNGMNLAGYGPVSEAMGGTSMAYDNGTAAVMNNPATLGLMSEGSSRVDVALGVLSPAITSSVTGASVDSSATAFYMPAMGYARKSGKMTFGAGVFSQGGMGTEYAGNSFMAWGTGKTVRSEVGVGRILVPLAYDIDDKLTVGGSVDYVWAGMDLQMAMDFATQMAPMMAPGGGTFGVITMDAGTGAALGGVMGGFTGNSVGYFDFSDNSKFSGKAQGSGYAGNIGFTYKVNQKFTVGGTYHSKTALGDLNASGVTLALVDVGGAGGTVPISGSISVKNFQWPETYGIGMAYQLNDQTMLMADYKRIGWAGVMQNFHMVFSPSSIPGGFIDATLYQKWEDQNVFELGGAYKMDAALTLRAGLNIANNPVPDLYMNPLFPAIAKNHVTLGAGYEISKVSSVDFSYVYVPKVTATSGSGVTVDFGGFSSQLMYSYKY